MRPWKLYTFFLFSDVQGSLVLQFQCFLCEIEACACDSRFSWRQITIWARLNLKSMSFGSHITQKWQKTITFQSLGCWSCQKLFWSILCHLDCLYNEYAEVIWPMYSCYEVHKEGKLVWSYTVEESGWERGVKSRLGDFPIRNNQNV